MKLAPWQGGGGNECRHGSSAVPRRIPEPAGRVRKIGSFCPSIRAEMLYPLVERSCFWFVALIRPDW